MDVPLSIHVSVGMLVMVGGRTIVSGSWDVTPTSKEPAHISVEASSRICRYSFRIIEIYVNEWCKELTCYGQLPTSVPSEAQNHRGRTIKIGS